MRGRAFTVGMTFPVTIRACPQHAPADRLHGLLLITPSAITPTLTGALWNC